MKLAFRKIALSVPLSCMRCVECKKINYFHFRTEKIKSDFRCPFRRQFKQHAYKTQFSFSSLVPLCIISHNSGCVAVHPAVFPFLIIHMHTETSSAIQKNLRSGRERQSEQNSDNRESWCVRIWYFAADSVFSSSLLPFFILYILIVSEVAETMYKRLTQVFKYSMKSRFVESEKNPSRWMRRHCGWSGGRRRACVW